MATSRVKLCLVLFSDRDKGILQDPTGVCKGRAALECTVGFVQERDADVC